MMYVVVFSLAFGVIFIQHWLICGDHNLHNQKKPAFLLLSLQNLLGTLDAVSCMTYLSIFPSVCSFEISVSLIPGLSVLRLT